MPRILKDVDVQFISLVSKGANKRTIIYKSASNRQQVIQREIAIVKTDDEKHLVYGIVYAPEDVDTQGDMMNAVEIEKAAHKFLANLRNTSVDKQHDENPDEGVVVESFIVQKGDERFPGDEGAWAVAIKVVKEETWEQVKKGEITGLSMGAWAATDEVVKSGTFVDKLLTAVRKKFSVRKDFNDEMLKQQIWPMMDALASSFWQIMQDDTIVDKKGAFADCVQQMKDYFTAKKSADPEGGTPAGDQTISEGDIDMKPEEVAALVTSAVEKAVKPLQEEVTGLKKTIEDGDKAVAERVEKLEKASVGSNRALGTETPDEIVIEDQTVEVI
jgi:hypothetical protein